MALSQWFLYTEKIECVNKDETSGGGGLQHTPFLYIEQPPPPCMEGIRRCVKPIDLTRYLPPGRGGVRGLDRARGGGVEL